MAKSGKLNVKKVRNASPGMHNDGDGLWLSVKVSGGKNWLFRYTFRGRRREQGLGSAHTVSLTEARESARKMRNIILKGLDPIEVRRKERAALVPTFKECATRFIETHRSEWANPKHAQQWERTLETYAFPVIGRIPVDQIETPDIIKVLTPIWTEKTETANRVRGRIERILASAAAQNLRPRENPATWRNHLDQVFPKPSRIRKVRHHRALPWAEVPAFLKRLRKQKGIGSRALEFLILTAARSGEVRGATWAEIDLDRTIWTVPAERMKNGREHRVPLSKQALSVLEKIPHLGAEDFLFPAIRGGKLSDMAMTTILRKMNVDAVPHGFRSSFRDWAAESSTYPHDVCEMALAHTIANKVEAAYRRGDLFKKRKRLMQDWADYCDHAVEPRSATVVSIGAGR